MDGVDEVETRLPDLREMSFKQMHTADLRPYQEAMEEQVQRPRTNLGSGPPGRAD